MRTEGKIPTCRRNFRLHCARARHHKEQKERQLKAEAKKSSPKRKAPARPLVGPAGDVVNLSDTGLTVPDTPRHVVVPDPDTGEPQLKLVRRSSEEKRLALKANKLMKQIYDAAFKECQREVLRTRMDGGAESAEACCRRVEQSYGMPPNVINHGRVNAYIRRARGGAATSPVARGRQRHPQEKLIMEATANIIQIDDVRGIESTVSKVVSTMQSVCDVFGVPCNDPHWMWIKLREAHPEHCLLQRHGFGRDYNRVHWGTTDNLDAWHEE